LLEHGGALRAAAARYSLDPSDWLDLSTGINPNGWPVPAVHPMAWQLLPEPNDGLEAAAAAYYGTPHLLPVAGSQAAIQALPPLRDLGRVGVLSPTYAEHAHAWRRVGHQVELLAADGLDAASGRLDALVVVNPNNPTGARFPAATLLDWRARLAARGGWLVVDEAFVDATPAESLAVHAGLPGLIVLRSLGKFFGLAGARVGFVLAEPVLLARMAEQLGPWTVTGPSRWVAKQALADRAWQEETRLGLARSGERLADLLGRQALAVAGGTSLFQWVPSPDAEFWQDALGWRGILVRCFTDPPGLRFGLPGLEQAWRRLERVLADIRAKRWVRGR
jgi:cobalamin biosynthetic protein CobC